MYVAGAAVLAAGIGAIVFFTRGDGTKAQTSAPPPAKSQEVADNNQAPPPPPPTSKKSAAVASASAAPADEDPKELKIEDLEKGSGEREVKTGDKILVSYTGKLLKTGKEFEYKPEKRNDPPVELVVGEKMIEGWSKGLLGMKAGGKRKLTIPAPMAFGDKGRPPDVPANAPVVYEFELLKIDDGKVASTGPVGDGGGTGACSKCNDGKPSAATTQAVQGAAGAARGCYNRIINKGGGLGASEGKLTVLVSVGANGQVCSATIAGDTVGSAEVSNCVLKQFQGKSFPKPDQGCVTYKLPVSFAVKKD